MKQVKLIMAVTAFTACFTVTRSWSQTNTGTPNVLGVFVASTPCSEGTRPLPGIPAKGDCEFIIWNLTLYQDPNRFTPTTYKLEYSYGISQPGTPGFIGGGTKLKMEGKWTVAKGAGSDSGRIYRLDTGTQNRFVSLLKLNDHLLHLLDTEMRLMIGNASFSYTLSKVINK